MVAFSGAVETVLALVRTTRGARLSVNLSVNELARAVTLVDGACRRLPWFLRDLFEQSHPRNSEAGRCP